MQQAQDGAQHITRRGAHFARIRAVAFGKNRLGEFDEPVTEGIPREAVAHGGVVIEAIQFQRRRCLGHRFVGLVENPAIQRQTRRAGVKGGIRHHIVHFAETGNVPEFGDEAAIGFHARRAQLHVPARPGQRADGEAQRVGAEFVDQLQRVHDVPFGFRHFLAALITHQAMDIDGLERHIAHEMNAHHHHPGDPEEDDVEARHQHIAGIIPG